ncbi:MAG: biotin synthase BioB [Chloroflexi bacterium]|nr:biotin synthase BioB [Chloroflexota bacterium]
MEYRQLAAKSLRGEVLTGHEALTVLRTPDDNLLELLKAAFQVRKTYFGKKVQLYMLQNAKSGLCPEDCGYCSQSSVSKARIDKYPLLDEERLLAAARQAKEVEGVQFCIVDSGSGPTEREIAYLCRVVRRIKKEVGIHVCTSLGLLTEAKASALKEAGVDRYNHNLNTSERFYPEICTTHTYQDRLRTLRYARDAGLELCAGVIFGMGESEQDIIEVGHALRDLNPESLPVNFLQPIPGTPLEKVNYLTPIQCLRVLCLVRFLNPRSELRVAGGRESHLRSLQPLALYPANSIFVSGYLTTPGQTPEEAKRMIEDLGFEVAAT